MARRTAGWSDGTPQASRRGQGGAGAVEMVDAPAAEPRAVRLLLGEQPAQAALDGVAVALRRQRLERVRGDVGARLVGDLAEVAERDLVEPHRARCRRRTRPSRRRATACRRASRARAAPRRRRRRARAARAGRRPRRRCRDRCRSRTRTPSHRARGRARGSPSRPSPSPPREEVLAGTAELRMVGRDAARAQREHRERRVPHGRLARLGTQPVAVLDHEALPALDRLARASGPRGRCRARSSAMIPHTHGGWMPPHDPSASCRARIQRSARAAPFGAAGSADAGGRVLPGRAPIARRSTSTCRRDAATARARARRTSVAPSMRSRRSRTAAGRQQHELGRDRRPSAATATARAARGSTS